jgi:hypothetical protein
MKKRHFLLLTTIAVVAILAFLYYYLDGKFSNESFNNKNYKWITSGTCASHNMNTLTQSDCSGYLNSSNYSVNMADHGPPGCWLLLGDRLDGVVKKNPDKAGKGFACWSKNESDGMKCSADVPCICK